MDRRIGRPAREETAEYYHPYIDLVPDGDIRLILDDQRQETLPFLQSIPETLARHRYAPEKWSVKNEGHGSLVPINATVAGRRTFDTGRASMTGGWTGTFEQLEACLAKAR